MKQLSWWTEVRKQIPLTLDLVYRLIGPCQIAFLYTDKSVLTNWCLTLHLTGLRLQLDWDSKKRKSAPHFVAPSFPTVFLLHLFYLHSLRRHLSSCLKADQGTCPFYMDVKRSGGVFHRDDTLCPNVVWFTHLKFLFKSYISLPTWIQKISHWRTHFGFPWVCRTGQRYWNHVQSVNQSSVHICI